MPPHASIESRTMLWVLESLGLLAAGAFTLNLVIGSIVNAS
jgi:hypothetical protein